jgi:ankyrin repeat protein
MRFESQWAREQHMWTHRNLDDGDPAPSRCRYCNVIYEDLSQHLDDHHHGGIFRAAARGDVRAVWSCLSENPDLVSTHDETGEIPLHTAVRHGQEEVVRLLLRRESRDNTINMYTSVPVPDSIEHRRPCETALHIAATRGFESIVKLLLDNGAEVNGRMLQRKYGDTPLHVAVTSGHVEVTQVLLNAGADPNARAGEFISQTPLHRAARAGFYVIVRDLLEAGSHVNAPDGYTNPGITVWDYTALHHAASWGHAATVGLLLQKGAKVNVKSQSQGLTPLFLGAQNGHEDVVKILLRWRADPNIRNGSAKDHTGLPLYCAVRNKHESIARLLLSAGARTNFPELGESTEHQSKGMPLVHLAILNEQPSMLSLILSHGASVHTRDSSEDADSPLHAAIKINQEAMVNDILRCRGVDVEALNAKEITPLQYTARYGTERIAWALIVKGARVEFCKAGYPPLLEAIIHGNDGVVNALVGSGADVNARYGACNTSLLHEAVHAGNEKIVRILIEKGTAIEARNDNKTTPLLFAVRKGYVGMTRVLLEAGANVNVHDIDARSTALHYAVVRKDMEIIRLLVQYGADVNAVESYPWCKVGFTPLHHAAAWNYVPGIKFLLDAGADPNISVQGPLPGTPLHCAVTKMEVDSVKALLDGGADPNGADLNKRSPWGAHARAPIWYALPQFSDHMVACVMLSGRCKEEVKLRSVRIVRALLEKGCDTRGLYHGKTLLDWALEQEEEYPELCEVLRRAGVPCLTRKEERVGVPDRVEAVEDGGQLESPRSDEDSGEPSSKVVDGMDSGRTV